MNMDLSHRLFFPQLVEEDVKPKIFQTACWNGFRAEKENSYSETMTLMNRNIIFLLMKSLYVCLRGSISVVSHWRESVYSPDTVEMSQPTCHYKLFTPARIATMYDHITLNEGHFYVPVMQNRGLYWSQIWVLRKPFRYLIAIIEKFIIMRGSKWNI